MSGTKVEKKACQVVYLYPSTATSKVPKLMESHVIPLTPDIIRAIMRTLELSKYNHPAYDIVINTNDRLVVKHKTSGNVYILRDEPIITMSQEV